MEVTWSRHYWAATLALLCPAVLVVLVVLTLARQGQGNSEDWDQTVVLCCSHSPASYGSLVFPDWVDRAGWALALLPFLPVLLCAAATLCRGGRELWRPKPWIPRSD